MNLIDVTLRDGGFAVDFNWPLNFAIEYYKTVSSISKIKYVELGYWKQTAKSKNPFYNLNQELVEKITESKRLKNVSIMIDYHYCSKSLSEYPTNSQDEIGMIRLCSRKEDLKEAISFGVKLKSYTKLKVSLNVFNSSNYNRKELNHIKSLITNEMFDYVYLADTHGSLDFENDFNKYLHFFDEIIKKNIKVGFHLHDHSGRAFSNYRFLNQHNINSSDTSIKGMGKGSGNLKLENVLTNEKDLLKIAELISKYSDLLNMNPNPYELITSMLSITDNYASYANKNKFEIREFFKKCRKIKGVDKDSYNEELML